MLGLRNGGRRRHPVRRIQAVRFRQGGHRPQPPGPPLGRAYGVALRREPQPHGLERAHLDLSRVLLPWAALRSGAALEGHGRQVVQCVVDRRLQRHHSVGAHTRRQPQENALQARWAARAASGRRVARPEGAMAAAAPAIHHQCHLFGTHVHAGPHHPRVRHLGILWRVVGRPRWRQNPRGHTGPWLPNEPWHTLSSPL